MYGTWLQPCGPTGGHTRGPTGWPQKGPESGPPGPIWALDLSTPAVCCWGHSAPGRRPGGHGDQLWPHNIFIPGRRMPWGQKWPQKDNLWGQGAPQTPPVLLFFYPMKKYGLTVSGGQQWPPNIFAPPGARCGATRPHFQASRA